MRGVVKDGAPIVRHLVIPSEARDLASVVRDR